MAVNLLPEYERAALRREYYLRLSIVALAFLFFCLIVGIALLVPSYILSSGTRESLEERAALLAKSSSSAVSADIDRKRSEIEARLSVLSGRAGGYPPTAFVEGVARARPSGVKIERLSVVGGAADASFVTVSGIAESREALLSFSRALEKIPLFKKTELPLSDLARSQAIPFTIRMEAASPAL
jgi:Tfp pilus assembly protein PilN